MGVVGGLLFELLVVVVRLVVGVRLSLVVGVRLSLLKFVVRWSLEFVVRRYDFEYKAVDIWNSALARGRRLYVKLNCAALGFV